MVKDPFEDLEITEPVVEATKDTDLFGQLSKKINRLAEIEDELDSRGNDDLLKEQKKLKAEVKKLMLSNDLNFAYDEASNYEGVLSQRHTDTWDEEKFKTSVPKKKHKRYFRVIPKHEELDVVAVIEGVKNGDLSLAQLTVDGAFAREPTNKALYVREREKDDA